MRGAYVRACLAAWISCFVLTACSSLPRSGPPHQAIDRQAVVKISSEGRKAGIDYVLVDIGSTVVGQFDAPAANSLEKGFDSRQNLPPATVIGVGDVLEVTIFEAQAGGLFVPDDAGSRPGNYITLPKQSVDRAGTINVPYAGAIQAAGRPVSQVQAEIEKRLVNRAIEPQVIITTTLSRSANVSVLGSVKAPAQMALSPVGERLLDVIARAGGLDVPEDEARVTLERKGKQVSVYFRTLLERPAENIYLRPGDTVIVARERRTFLTFGATGLSGRIDFEDSDLTLGEAIAKSGGLLDERADPAQVFLYREVERKALAKFGADISRFNADIVPAVFRANLRDPAAFFAIQKFPMKDKDILYISNAETVELAKFLDLVNGVSASSASLPANALVSRNSLQRLGR